MTTGPDRRRRRLDARRASRPSCRATRRSRWSARPRPAARPSSWRAPPRPGRGADGRADARPRRDRRDRASCSHAPRRRVLILTTFEEDDYIFGGLRAGASGFLLKRTRARGADRRRAHDRRRRLTALAVGHPPRDRPHGRAARGRARLVRASRTDPPRARRARAPRQRAVQRRDRRRAGGRGVDGQDAREAHPDEARPARPSAGRDLRLRARGQPARLPPSPRRDPTPTSLQPR